MRNFAFPQAFFLLIPIVGVILLRFYKVRKFRARLPFPDLSIATKLPETVRARFCDWPQYLLYGALILAVIALARPRTLLKGAETQARGIDIVIALDTSGSMRALDFDPQDRMAIAKKATKTFISNRHFDRIGLVVFGGVSLLQCPLTLDYGALLEFLEQVSVGMTQTENTAVGSALATAANRLKKSTAKSRVIILVTDGRNNAGEIDPLTAARAAGSVGIRVYTIGVGIRGPSKIPVETAWGRQLVPIQEDLDEPSLEELARATGGRYFRATSTRDFDEVYREIDQLEKTEIKGAAPQEFQDQYLGWLLVAMILLCASYGLEMTLLRTNP